MLFRFCLASVVLACCWYVYGADRQFYIREDVLKSVEEQHGPEARQRVFAWQGLVQKDRANRQMVSLDKLKRANDFFNQVKWVTDIAHWGQDDYWATPVETLATNGGDCEDFSIGKYFSLEHAALPIEKLRITYVKALDYNQAHMVLAYYETPSSEPLILDNINKTILPASERSDLLPIYSFDAKSIWLAQNRGRKLEANSMTSLPKWREVNDRLGFEYRSAD